MSIELKNKDEEWAEWEREKLASMGVFRDKDGKIVNLPENDGSRLY